MSSKHGGATRLDSIGGLAAARRGAPARGPGCRGGSGAPARRAAPRLSLQLVDELPKHLVAVADGRTAELGARLGSRGSAAGRERTVSVAL